MDASGAGRMSGSALGLGFSTGPESSMRRGPSATSTSGMRVSAVAGVGSSALDMTAATARSSVAGAPTPGADNIKSLILQKERELHEMTEYRITTLERAMKEKERELHEAQSKYQNLKTDFQYNLKLIEDRDAELERNDATFANLQNAVRQRDSQISELRIKLDDAVAKLHAAEAAGEQERIVAESRLKELQSASTQHVKASDARVGKLQEEIAALRREAAERARGHESELQNQRKEITAAFEKALARHDQDRTRTERELAQQLESGESLATKLHLDLEVEQKQKAEALAKVELLETQFAQSQQALRDATDRALRDAQAKEKRISTLEREKDEVRAAKQSLFDQYEAKMAELLKSLHTVERACSEQQSKYSAELASKQLEKEEAVRDMRVSMETQLQAGAQKLAASETKLFRLEEEIKAVKSAADDKVAAVEAQIDSEKRQHESTRSQFEAAKEDWHAQRVELETRLANERARMHDLTIAAESADDNVAALKHEIAVLRRREEELKSDAAAANERWNKRWQEREVQHNLQYDGMVAKLDEQRERVLAAQQEGQERAMRLEEELTRVKEQLTSAHTEARLAQMLKPPDTAAGLASPAFTDDMGPASPVMRGLRYFRTSASGDANGMTAAARAEELAELRSKVAELEAQNGRYRTVIADMRSQMETWTAEQLDKASGSGAGGDGDGTQESWQREKADMAAALQRAEAYAELLQRRVDDGRRAAMQGGEHAGGADAAADLEELTLLRRHNRELNATVAQLRGQLAVASKEQEMLRTKVAAAQVERDEAQRDAMNAQETAKQLIKQKAELEGALEAAKLSAAANGNGGARGRVPSDAGSQASSHPGSVGGDSSVVGAVMAGTVPRLASARLLVDQGNGALPPPHPVTPAHHVSPQHAAHDGGGVRMGVVDGYQTPQDAATQAQHKQQQQQYAAMMQQQQFQAQQQHAQAMMQHQASLAQQQQQQQYYSPQHGYPVSSAPVQAVPPPRPPPPTPGLVWAEPMTAGAAMPGPPPPQPPPQRAGGMQQAPLDPRAAALLTAASPWQAALQPPTSAGLAAGGGYRSGVAGWGAPGQQGQGQSDEEVTVLRTQVERATKDLERMVAERGQLLDVSNRLRSDLDKVVAAAASEETVAQAVQRAQAETARQYETRINEVYKMQRELAAENRQLSKALQAKAKAKAKARKLAAAAAAGGGGAGGDGGGGGSNRGARASRHGGGGGGGGRASGVDVRMGMRVDADDGAGDGVAGGGVGASRRYDQGSFANVSLSGNPYQDDVGSGGGGRRQESFRDKIDNVREQLGVKGTAPPTVAGSRASMRPGSARALPATNSLRQTQSQLAARARVAAAAQSSGGLAGAVGGSMHGLRDRAAILAERRRVRNYNTMADGSEQ